MGEHFLQLRRTRLQRGKGFLPARLGQLGIVIDPAQLRQHEIDRHRPGKADQSDPPRPAAREPARYRRQHRRPHEAHPQRPQRRRDQRGQRRVGGAEQVEPRRRRQGADQQQPHVGKAMLQRAREVPHHEHDRRDIDQHQNARHPHRLAERDVHPRPRRQFGRGGEEHDREKDPERRALERFGQHLAKADALHRALGLRKVDPQRPQPQHDPRQDRQRHRQPPVQVQLAEQHHAGQPADHDPERPPGVQAVELAGLVIGIDRGGHRVDRRLGRAPAEAPDHHREVEQQIDRPACQRRHEHQRRPRDKAGRRKQHHPPRADPVEQRADHQQAERKAQERAAQHGPDHLARMLRVDRIEQRRLQRPRRARAQRIGQRGGKQRQHADPVNGAAIVSGPRHCILPHRAHRAPLGGGGVSSWKPSGHTGIAVLIGQISPYRSGGTERQAITLAGRRSSPQWSSARPRCWRCNPVRPPASPVRTGRLRGSGASAWSTTS